LQKELPDHAEPLLKGIAPEHTADFFGQARNMIKKALSEQMENWRAAGKSAAKLLSVVIICGVFSLFPDESGQRTIKIGTMTVAAESPTSPVPTPAPIDAIIYQNHSITFSLHSKIS
jgi:hypothetical protein